MTDPVVEGILLQIRERMREGLKSFIGDLSYQEVAQARLRDAVEVAWGRSLDERPHNPIRVEYSGNLAKVFFDASPEEVVDITNSMYDRSAPHEEITAWLDQHAPSFRDHLVEVKLPSGHLQWIVRPSWVMKA